MSRKLDFSIKCEGDCERISKVFIEWLKTDSPELKKKQSITAPNAHWAHVFSEIYADEIENHDLADLAEQNVISIDFNVYSYNPLPTDLSKLSNKQLMDLLEEFLEDFGDTTEDESEED